jgi:hypothetical protein
MTLRFAACTAVIGILAGCDTHGQTAPPRELRPIVVTRDDGSLPARCGVRRTTSRVLAFIDAFNSGDGAALDRSIADREHFQWYSVNEEGGKRRRSFNATGISAAVDGAAPEKDQRPELLRYLANRGRAGERMHLVQVMVSRIRPHDWLPNVADEAAGVEYSVRITAPELAAFPGRNRLAGGKGAFGCSDGRLLMWTMGLETANGSPMHNELLCRPASRVREDARRVIACSGW